MRSRVTAALLCAAAFVAGAGMPAYAQSLPGPGYNLTRDWSGFYVASLGSGVVATTVGVNGGTDTWRINGGAVTAIIGQNWQMQNWVFGVEFEAGYAFANGTSDPGFNGGVTASLGATTAVIVRIGVAANQTLIYGMFGPNYQQFSANGPFYGGVAEKRNTLGWSIGFGAERPIISDNLSLRGELLLSRMHERDFNGIEILVRPKTEIRFGLVWHMDEGLGFPPLFQ